MTTQKNLKLKHSSQQIIEKECLDIFCNFNKTITMKNKQFLADTILLLIVFVGGYVTNSLFNSKSNIESLLLQECDPSYLCFPLNNEEIRVSSQTYIDLLDNKIDGTGNSKWTLERRLGNRPVHKSKLNRPVYRQNNDNWHQVYIDVYKNKDNKIVKTFTLDVYRQF